jgi:hypothetical protein
MPQHCSGAHDTDCSGYELRKAKVRAALRRAETAARRMPGRLFFTDNCLLPITARESWLRTL